MRVVIQEKLCELQKNPSRIRNICIMAHVDHGKTTLADSLVASNGIISARMAGKLRYMDSRKDEQERGITMKSSSIALHYNTGGTDYLVNLIDSPGHVDFSSEVSTAVRLCDGAVILVDVVEGVCPQTQIALKQAWMENIKPVLVLNKLDRLILELKLTPLDAYVHLTQVLEQVNAVMGELFTTDILERGEKVISLQQTVGKPDLYNWSDGLDQADDSTLYFSPEQGNVIFASAVDGWGFSVNDFAVLYSKKLELDQNILRQTLWGDFYLNSKLKQVVPGAQEKAKKPLFVQFVLENIWALYDIICIRKDKEKLGKIIESLGVKVTTRDLRHTDPKVQLQAVFSQWLPLAAAVLDMVCSILPPANQLSDEKVEKLMCSKNRSFESLPEETQELKQAFLSCSSEQNAPIIVYISKMFPVERKCLPQNKPQVLSSEEIAKRREQARLRHSAKMAEKEGTQIESEVVTEPNDPAAIAQESEEPLSDDVFIAFARVFSGTLRKGQDVYVLGPKHNPAEALKQLQKGVDVDENLTLKDLKHGQHITKAVISELYLMMGKELEALEEVPAGNVLGIGGLEEHVLKSATLSTEIFCPSFSELQLIAVPILRVAVEPAKPTDLPALLKGLKLLNQADACVQVIVQETGEHVLVTAGEVHLERCLNDLKERYAKVPVVASEPIVPFRETIVIPPTVDMVNESIQEQSQPKKKTETDDSLADGVVTMQTPSKQSTMMIVCSPLPEEVTSLLENNAELLKILDSYTNIKQMTEVSAHKLEAIDELSPSQFEKMNIEEVEVLNRKEEALGEKTMKAINSLKLNISKSFEKAGGIWSRDLVNKIWCFGPRRCGPNILINMVKGYERNVWDRANKEEINNKLYEYDNSFSNGFQLATLAGPLCEEPMMGVAFLVQDWEVNLNNSVSGSYGPLSGQIMSMVKEGCRKSFQAQPQRLMAAMYSCSIQANGDILGKMYAVIGRRQGRILHGDMAQGSASFKITAVLPVVESFNFAQEFRKQTSGLAIPQLLFSHWEVIDLDPFWVPSTEEEYLHYGEKADTENRARQYMNSVRKRKGLAVYEKIVEFAEKQRTLSKKK